MCTRSIEQMGCSNKPLSKSDRSLLIQPVCGFVIYKYWGLHSQMQGYICNIQRHYDPNLIRGAWKAEI